MASEIRGICRECGQECFYGNRSRRLCCSCNFKRLHGGMSKYEWARQRALDKKKLKRRPQSTGELAVFKSIWLERPHVCVKCGRVLEEPPKAGYFSHIKSKGSRPDLRLDKDNIELVCLACHARHEFGFNYEQ